MPKATVICYLFSLLFYGMGYLKMLVLKNAVVNNYDYTIYVSLATTYFVLTIFLAVIGSLFFYVKTIKDQEIIEINSIEYRLKKRTRSDIRRRVNISEAKAQLSQPEYVVKLDRRMSS